MKSLMSYIDIEKRQKCINSTIHNMDSNYLYKIADKSISDGSDSLKHDIGIFFESCTDPYNSNNHFKECMDIISKINDNQYQLSLINKFSNDIIPYIKDLNAVSSYIGECTIDDSYIISESINKMKTADRIISNNNKISNRFNLSNIIDTYRSIDELMECVCPLIDTFDSIPLYGKMNTIIEEMNYLLAKSNIDFDNNILVESTLDYFLISRDELSCEDISNFKHVLETNKFIKDDDLSNVKYFLEGDLADSNEVKKILDEYKKEETKSVSLFKRVLSRIYTKNPKDIIDETPTILNFIRKMIVFSTIAIPGIGPLVLLIAFITDKYIELNLKEAEIKKVITAFNNERDKTEKLIIKSKSSSKVELQKYLDELDKAISKLEQYKSEQLDMEEDDYDDELEESVYLNEFKLFKFHNLISGVLLLDKFLANKENNIVRKLKSKTKNIFKKINIFEEDAKLYSCINKDDHTFSYCVSTFECDEKDISDVRDIVIELCNYINNNPFKFESYNLKYNRIDNVFRLYIKDNCYIIFDDNELNQTISEADAGLYNVIYDLSENYDKINMLNTDTIQEDAYKYIPSNDDMNIILYFIEFAKYSMVFDKENIKPIIEEYCTRYEGDYKSTIINTNYNQFKKIDTDLSIQIEADLYIRQIINSSILNEKMDIDKTINTIKLGLQSIKSKAKQLSSKEKEASRNLDATANHFIRSIQQAMVSDRRENIIKNSVIPSFSKCIKIGIALAGLGLVIDPIAPVITAFCGFCISKNLTRKERILLLDEIDVELQALEKEISNAESNNQMKKYRKLLMHQKKLQRERTRIKYNIKTNGMQDIPSSSVKGD